MGLSYARKFCPENVHPFDTVEWEVRTAQIKDDKGAILFEQEFEVPKSWSQLATNVEIGRAHV